MKKEQQTLSKINTLSIPRLTTNLLIAVKLVALFMILFYRYPLYWLYFFLFLVAVSLSGELFSLYAEKKWQHSIVNLIYTSLVVLDAVIFAAVLFIFRLFSSDFYLLGLLTLLIIPFRGGVWIGILSGSLISFFYLWVTWGSIPEINLFLRTTSLMAVCLVSGYWGEVLEGEMEQKKALAQEVERLRELNELKDEFIAVATHNLRSPVTALKGYLEALAEEETEPEKLDFASKMRQLLSRLERLVDEFLAIARLKTGRWNAVAEEVNPRPLLKEVVDAFRPAIEQKKLRFLVEFKFPSSLRIKVNPPMFKRSVENLLDNALKYTEKGMIKLRATMEGENFLVAVADTGCGIPEEEKEKIFQAFYRSQRTSKVKGAGLGLYIVKKFIEQSGGQLVVESKIGRGSEFKLLFPSSLKGEFLAAL